MGKPSSPAQKIIVGIDEAGRGPLAGPVVAAAFCVVGKPKFRARGDFDSKKLKPQWREDLYQILTTHPQVEWGIGQVSEKQIDNINILQATRLAMVKAVKNLQQKLRRRPRESYHHFSHDRRKSDEYFPIDSLIIDGNILLDLPIPQQAIPKADTTIFSCMAASIIAKVTRDRLILRLHKKYPQYGFDRHKGYGTKLHFAMLKKHGPCPIHRLSFAPCKPKGLTNPKLLLI